MKLSLFQIDAFTDKLFAGNPAAVCPLNDWLPEATMQKIAAENNLSETAFFVKEGEHYHIRWFTPTVEIALCGHATVATVHVLTKHLGIQQNNFSFTCKSGLISVKHQDDLYILNFPSDTLSKATPTKELIEALGTHPLETCKGKHDYLLVFENEKQIRNFEPDWHLLNQVQTRGICVTAPGEKADFVSRFFAPAAGINEDPVTGSAHTSLIPYWAKRLGKNKLFAQQVSARGGELWCEYLGDRVLIGGKAVSYLEGTIQI